MNAAPRREFAAGAAGAVRTAVAAAALVLALLLATPASASIQLSDFFTGVGVGGNYHLTQSGSDGSLYLAGRTGELGLVGYGLVGDLGYRFGEGDLYGRVGVDAFLAVFGVRLDLAAKGGLAGEGPDLGLGYALEVLLPAPYPIFFSAGGQSYVEGGTEFIAGVSIMIKLDGEPLRW